MEFKYWVAIICHLEVEALAYLGEQFSLLIEVIESSQVLFEQVKVLLTEALPYHGKDLYKVLTVLT